MTRSIKILLTLLLITGLGKAYAQTEVDAIMMNKNQFCFGPMFSYSSWDHYWEGTLKRTNENLGTVSTKMFNVMGNWGITNNLNLMFSVPYVKTKATAGTLAGMKGIQDLSIYAKWRFMNASLGKGKLKLFAIAGFSTPLDNYVVDFLPLSVGLGSTNGIFRFQADYQYKKFTVTVSTARWVRSNVKIDRTSYYDTEMHYTNVVDMPNASQQQLRAGYRGKYLIAEAILNKWTTKGGFDITRNNMPFPSNRMNSTSLGVSAKYTIPSFTNLSLLAGAMYTLEGRNVGQSTQYNGGIFYAFYANKKSKPQPKK